MFENLDEALSVEEFVKQRNLNKLWLCPHEVSNGKVVNPPWLAGFECSPSTIPDEIKDRKVVKHFKENSTLCIIWYYQENVRLSEKSRTI